MRGFLINFNTVTVFPDSTIRVCLFHIIQAIGHADFTDGDVDLGKLRTKKRKKGVIRGAVSLKARNTMVAAFCKVQRYRGSIDPKPWCSYRNEFEVDVQAICDDHDIESMIVRILRYFDKYWFTEFWRS